MLLHWARSAGSRDRRRTLLMLLDSTTWIAVSLAALFLVASSDPVETVMTALAITATAVLFGQLTGVYSSRWRVGEFRSTFVLAQAVLAGTLALALALAILDRPASAPVAAAAGALAMVALAGARLAWRWANELPSAASLSDGQDSAVTKAIFFGAGSGGRLILESLRSETNPSLHAVAILDDDPTLHGREIAGLIVAGGRDCLESLVKETGATELVVAIPSADRDLIGLLALQARSLGLHPSVVPSVAELVNSVVHPDDIRSVTPADLLGRRPVDMNLIKLGDYVADKVVLVTGAGGSIGSELCLQLNRLGPAKLVMLDRDESALHALQLSLDGRGQLDTDTLVVADIRDSERIDQLFEYWQPDVVFHTAALKHLPLLEMYPHEGVKTNVGGTHNLLQAAAKNGTKRFVNVSTDKAADPTSVLGWTKHLAERLTTRVGMDNNRPYLSVRFGNVLGSRGSVLTAFTRQIEEGGPVTVTDPDVTRFFMTVEEAASLVIAAGASNRTGDVMILEMGEPVSILQMAQDLIERSGKSVKVVFTGLRPGEKVHEVLRSSNEPITKTEDGIMWRGAIEPINWEDVEPLFMITQREDLMSELERIGGPPSKLGSTDILLSPPEIGDEERVAVQRALDSGWIAPAGAELSSFESEIAQYCGGESVLATGTGTGALHLALLVAGVKPGDEVVVQTTTFAASAFAVNHAQAVPVFCDTDDVTGMMDPDLLAEFLSTRSQENRLPAAVMTVDLYGFCADYNRIVAICDSYGVPVIQDAAEALGSISQGKSAGTHGHLGVFSFNGNKIITTSGGGALVGSPENIARATKLATQAREPIAHYEHTEIGYNYRLSNILAALGRAQLARLDDRIERRLAIATQYQSKLTELSWLPNGVTERPNNWLNVAQLPEGADPSEVVSFMMDKGIEARRSWKPMHLQPVYASNLSIGGRNAESFFERGICLPSAQSLSATDIDRVIDCLSTALTHSNSPIAIAGS